MIVVIVNAEWDRNRSRRVYVVSHGINMDDDSIVPLPHDMSLSLEGIAAYGYEWDVNFQEYVVPQ